MLIIVTQHGSELTNTVIFVEHERLTGCFRMSPISREIFIKDYFGPCYESSMGRNITLQDCALVYAILAMGEYHAPLERTELYPIVSGMLHSAEIPSYIQRSVMYISLARGCLAAGDFITNPTIGVIDTLLICTAYHFTVEDPMDPHKAWVLLGVALKLALGVGTFAICINLLLTSRP